jgi:hypothetical protein
MLYMADTRESAIMLPQADYDRHGWLDHVNHGFGAVFASAS